MPNTFTYYCITGANGGLGLEVCPAIGIASSPTFIIRLILRNDHFPTLQKREQRQRGHLGIANVKQQYY